jgi:hypothetical protein
MTDLLFFHNAGGWSGCEGNLGADANQENPTKLSKIQQICAMSTSSVRPTGMDAQTIGKRPSHDFSRRYGLPIREFIAGSLRQGNERSPLLGGLVFIECESAIGNDGPNSQG